MTASSRRSPRMTRRRVVDLVFDHWELSRENMELFIAPQGLKADALVEARRHPERRNRREVRRNLYAGDHAARADGEIDRKAFAEVLEVADRGRGARHHHRRLDRRVLCPHRAGALRQLAAYAKEVIGTRLPLIVGTGAIRTEDAVDYAKAAKAIEADAILVTSPPYALPTERENAVHALTIDRAADLPIMLYNYPGRMGVSMGEEYFARVGRSKNVVAIKESSGDMNRCTCWRGSFRTSPCPAAGTIRRSSSSPGGRGAGFAPGPTSCPAEHVALYEACVVEKNFDKGRRIMTGDDAAHALPRRRQVRAVDQVRLRVERPQGRHRCAPRCGPSMRKNKRGLQTVIAT